MSMFVGYLPEVDELPREARDLGLLRRSAFILETYRPDKVDAYFDAELYGALLEAVRNVLNAEKLTAVLPSGKTEDVSDPTACLKLLRSVPEVEQRPFERVTCHRDRTVLGLIGSEPWAAVGGPRPYDDSYTIPIFTADDVAGRLETEARAVCARLGATLEAVIRGSEQPITPGIWKRLWQRYFGY